MPSEAIPDTDRPTARHDHEPPPKRGDWGKWLGRRIKVYSAQDINAGQTPFVEGRVVAIITEPSVTVEDDEGNRTTWPASLPIRFQITDWKRP